MKRQKLDENDAPSTSASASSASSTFGLLSVNATKAGMSGLDTEKINSIVAEASKGSKFYEAKSKNQKRIDLQVDEMNRKLKNISPEALKSATRQADTMAESLKTERDLSRVIVHVDMDAFYAAVEERDNPELKDKPMAVGSLGMLSTSNYAARRYGVRAAMPGFIAKKLCPDLVIVPLNFPKYTEVSMVVREVFKEYDANFCPMSLDEAYLDITDYLESQRSLGKFDISAGDVVEELRTKIFERTKLTASAGIAPNTFLAKVCSDQKKPNGQFELPADAETIQNFVKSLPIRKVNGIGNVTEQLLKRVLGIETCDDLFNKRGYLAILFSELTFGFFLRTSLGLGNTSIVDMATRERKSMSTEATFRDTSNKDELFETVDSLCAELANDLLSEGLKGSQLTVKIKTHKFAIKTRASNLFQATNDVAVIKQTARKVLQWFMDTSEEQPLKLRLIGVRMSGFNERYEESFETRSKHQATLEAFLSSCSYNNSNSYSGASRRPSSSLLTSFSCPVCQQEIRTTNESAFNEHLDNCLQSSAQTQDETRSTDCPVCQSQIFVSSDAEFNSHVEQCLSDQRSADGNTSDKTELSCREAEKSKNFFGRNSRTEAPSIEDGGSKTEPSCPICGVQVEELSMNRHVDECLNAEALENLKSEQPQVVAAPKRKIETTSSSGSKRSRVQKDKSKSILNYFQPKSD